MKFSKTMATVAICASILSACGSAQVTVAPTLTPTLAATATPVPTPTPTPAPTAAPTARFGLSDTIVVGSATITISKVVMSASAVAQMTTASELFHTTVGNFRYGPGGATATPGSTLYLAKGWIPVTKDGTVPAGSLLGIRASVASGSATDLASLGLTVSYGPGTSASLLAGAWLDDGKALLWLFPIPTSAVGPYMLVFPSGETVDLGTPTQS